MKKWLLFTPLLALVFPLAGIADTAAGASSAADERIARAEKKLARIAAGFGVKNGVNPLEEFGYTILPARKNWFEDNYTEPETRVPAMAAGNQRSFYINNPLTLYGSVMVPTLDLDTDEVYYDDVYNIEGQDAILLFGRTPPDITYYSFVMNQFDQYYPDVQGYLETNTSIGLTVNQGNIRTQNDQTHGGFFTLAVGSDTATLALIRQFLVGLGIPLSVQNELMLPARYTRNAKADPDHVMFITRLTFRTQEELGKVLDYIQTEPAPIKALFLKGPGGAGDVLDGDLPQWEDTLRENTDEWDAGADVDLETLADVIKAQKASDGFTLLQEGFERLRHVKPQEWCRDRATSCNFDAPDALYGVFQCGDAGESCNFPLPNEEDEVYVLGVNHHEYADGELLTYFSHAVTRMSDLRGVAAIPDVELEGSAVQWTEGTGLDPNKFFIFRVSRDCTNDPYCMEVPYLRDGGVGPYQDVRVSSRVYLDKVTHSAPNPDSFVKSKLLWFVKPE